MRPTALLFAASVVVVAASVTARAQDFQKSYELNPGGHIVLYSTSGKITVSGYDGAAIQVQAFKEGRDSQKVEVEDRSTPDQIKLRSRYPANCHCEANLRFEVQVPRSIKYAFDSISTDSSSIEMVGVTGDMRLRTASGNIVLKDVSGKIDAASSSSNVMANDCDGPIKAQSASGNVIVEITRSGGVGDMEFFSDSGQVTVKAPDDLDAEVNMVSVSGMLETNFPIDVQETKPDAQQRRLHPRYVAKGRLGNGSRVLRVRSSSGNVSLNRN